MVMHRMPSPAVPLMPSQAQDSPKRERIGFLGGGVMRNNP